MSADTLRRAAAFMRERAKDASHGPWEARPHPDHPNGTLGLYSRKGGGWLVRPAVHGGFFNHNADAAHIASWHPAVALAVADWLDFEARTCEATNPNQQTVRALAVARAYLGEPA